MENIRCPTVTHHLLYHTYPWLFSCVAYIQQVTEVMYTLRDLFIVLFTNITSQKSLVDYIWNNIYGFIVSTCDQVFG